MVSKLKLPRMTSFVTLSYRNFQRRNEKMTKKMFIVGQEFLKAMKTFT